MDPVQLSPSTTTRHLGRACLLACAAAIGAALPTRISYGQAPKPDSSGYITTADGARLYYVIYSGGRDTLLVPGAALLAEPLYSLRDAFTVVFYDPRGRGQSDWIADPKRLTMDNEVRDLEAMRAGLGISKVGIIGFSYLGLMAAIYTADHPNRVARLAQLGPMAPDDETSSRYAPPERKQRNDSAAAHLARARAAVTDTSDFKADCRRWYDAYLPVFLGDPANAARVSTAYCEYENESPRKFLWRNDRVIRSIGRRWDYTKTAMAIRVPTLVIQGDKDFAVPPDGARRWAELIPDARLIMLFGAGHLAYAERSDRVLPALVRFFSGSWPPEAMQLRTSRTR